ncbi:MAG: methylated-DNA--[protein]-cysteine S-methyltransferase [Bacteroidales bacterium]|nr:methylated-DNA--[protein]-cysteine S-methyltransferase [Bacteroidales bacterium]
MEKTITIEHYKTPLGELILGSYDEKLCLCDWRFRKMRAAIDNRLKSIINAEFTEGYSPVLEETKHQLSQYFKQERTEFDLPLLLAGSDFQKSVWEALLRIPYGKTETYLGLSKILNNEQAIRAVAAANGANAISIVVPCHRIIGSNGKLVGYAGGLPVKKKLLELENKDQGSQLSLFGD